MNSFPLNKFKKKRSPSSTKSLHQIGSSHNSSSSLSSIDVKCQKQEEEENLQTAINLRIVKLIEELGFVNSVTTPAPYHLQRSTSVLSVNKELASETLPSVNQPVLVENIFRNEFKIDVFNNKLAFIYTGFDDRIGYVIVALKEEEEFVLCYVMTKIKYKLINLEKCANKTVQATAKAKNHMIQLDWAEAAFGHFLRLIYKELIEDQEKYGFAFTPAVDLEFLKDDMEIDSMAKYFKENCQEIGSQFVNELALLECSPWRESVSSYVVDVITNSNLESVDSVETSNYNKLESLLGINFSSIFKIQTKTLALKENIEFSAEVNYQTRNLVPKSKEGFNFDVICSKIKELVTSERAYLEKITLLEEKYYRPLRDGAFINDNYNTATSKARCFPDMTKLMNLIKNFIAELLSEDIILFEGLEIPTLNRMCKVFIQQAEKIRMEYISHFEDLDTSETYLRDCPNEDFHTRIRNIENDCIKEFEADFPDLTAFTLSDLRIQAVQRLPRYLMLFSDISNYIPEDHECSMYFSEAVNTMKSVVSSVDQQNVLEKTKKLVTVLSKSFEDESYKNAAYPMSIKFLISELLIEGTCLIFFVEKKKKKFISEKKTFLLQLFNDRLVLLVKTKESIEKKDENSKKSRENFKSELELYGYIELKGAEVWVSRNFDDSNNVNGIVIGTNSKTNKEIEEVFKCDVKLQRSAQRRRTMSKIFFNFKGGPVFGKPEVDDDYLPKNSERLEFFFPEKNESDIKDNKIEEINDFFEKVKLASKYHEYVKDDKKQSLKLYEFKERQALTYSFRKDGILNKNKKSKFLLVFITATSVADAENEILMLKKLISPDNQRDSSYCFIGWICQHEGKFRLSIQSMLDKYQFHTIPQYWFDEAQFPAVCSHNILLCLKQIDTLIPLYLLPESQVKQECDVNSFCAKVFQPPKYPPVFKHFEHNEVDAKKSVDFVDNLSTKSKAPVLFSIKNFFTKVVNAKEKRIYEKKSSSPVVLNEEDACEKGKLKKRFSYRKAAPKICENQKGSLKREELLQKRTNSVKDPLSLNDDESKKKSSSKIVEADEIKIINAQCAIEAIFKNEEELNLLAYLFECIENKGPLIYQELSLFSDIHKSHAESILKEYRPKFNNENKFFQSIEKLSLLNKLVLLKVFITTLSTSGRILESTEVTKFAWIGVIDLRRLANFYLHPIFSDRVDFDMASEILSVMVETKLKTLPVALTSHKSETFLKIEDSFTEVTNITAPLIVKKGTLCVIEEEEENTCAIDNNPNSPLDNYSKVLNNNINLKMENDPTPKKNLLIEKCPEVDVSTSAECVSNKLDENLDCKDEIITSQVSSSSMETMVNYNEEVSQKKFLDKHFGFMGKKQLIKKRRSISFSFTQSIQQGNADAMARKDSYLKKSLSFCFEKEKGKEEKTMDSN
ncbi:hypothetical protein HK099_007644 [Clydaea vesicula]|uniref:DH domain-containing protein n=1 Tax=Clydaea vesicula TaxID=447962 RepID=A0AAD5Y252_9FUNG|nr:hypothetical protein HK099_007644 [Clydaea vesicula]